MIAMELIDTHCHLTFKPLADNIEAVLERSKAAGVTGWVTVGTDLLHSKKSIELADRFENVYVSAGIHPHDSKHVTKDTLSELRKLLQNKKVVAIGETGLDFHYDFSPPEVQKQVFIQHLRLANELNLPVIVHCREAFDETMEILSQQGSNIEKLVFHCFTGNTEQAETIIEHGFYISFTGAVTFKNAEQTRASAKQVLLERLMIETDCPYMSPEPVRKQKVNEPALMIHTANFLADLKGMSVEKFADAVSGTSMEFFGI